MMRSSSPFHEGLGSALRKASTDFESANSTKTEPFLNELKVLADSERKSVSTYLELLRLVASHSHRVEFTILVKIFFQILLEPGLFFTKPFLEGKVISVKDM